MGKGPEDGRGGGWTFPGSSSVLVAGEKHPVVEELLQS